MCAAFPERIRRVITCTTRQPRDAELAGVDYHFMDEAAFARKIAAGEFLEHARVHQNFYGTRRSDVDALFAQGFDLLLNLDVQGAASVRAVAAVDARLRHALASIFIMPPSFEELNGRLSGRGTESREELERRLRVATQEMEQWPSYDFCLESHGRDEDFEQLKSVYFAEKMRVSRHYPAP
jgi:guanylate kinase